LKQHLIQGYTINEKRLFEEKTKLQKLQETIAFLQQKSRAKLLKGQEKEIIDLLADYSKTLTILEEYDKSRLKQVGGGKDVFTLSYEKCQKIIVELKKELIVKKEAGDLFGAERGGSFEGIVKNLYQTFGGKELYANLDAKAAHLLYLIIKDHPFSDGNKRTGAFLFVYFLDANNYLFRKNGERKINDNALAALALLIAESDPKEKDQMIALITQLLK
jgi:death-on-curing family protein